MTNKSNEGRERELPRYSLDLTACYPDREENLRKYFARAGFEESKREYIQADDGIRNLKRNLLGFFGWKTSVTNDRLMRELIEADIAKDSEEGKDIIESLCGKDCPGGLIYSNGNYVLHFGKDERERIQIRKTVCGGY